MLITKGVCLNMGKVYTHNETLDELENNLSGHNINDARISNQVFCRRQSVLLVKLE